VETEPAMAGATKTAMTKPARLSNGVTVQVPSFINQGDLVRVDPREGKYLERAKERWTGRGPRAVRAGCGSSFAARPVAFPLSAPVVPTALTAPAPTALTAPGPHLTVPPLPRPPQIAYNPVHTCLTTDSRFPQECAPWQVRARCVGR